MKNATIIFRVIPGFLYLVFDLDYFLHFIPYQPHYTGNAAAFKMISNQQAIFIPMQKTIQVAGGISLLINRSGKCFSVVGHRYTK